MVTGTSVLKSHISYALDEWLHGYSCNHNPFSYQETIKLLYIICHHRVNWEKIGMFLGVYRQ